MNYYIADPHFGHANIIEACGRPFASVDEMDRTLIENWNARVRPEDHVWVVGDLCYRNEKPASWYLERLSGHKHLIEGNHDKVWMRKEDASEFFESVRQFEFVHDGPEESVLCHYPLMTWPGKKHSGMYLIYGHIHNDKPEEFWPLLRTYERALNAGADVNGFAPVTLPELIANNAAWRAM
jgi:calcineurin-like phosphoesterase family protein